MMMTLKKIGSLALNKMRVGSNKILVVWNEVLWHNKNSLKEIFFSWYKYKMDKEFLKINDVEIEKLSKVSFFQKSIAYGRYGC